MKAANMFFKRILAFVLAVAIMTGSIIPAHADVGPAEFSKEFFLNVVSEHNGEFPGMFRYKNGQLYVDVQSIVGMADFIEYERTADGGVKINRGGFGEVTFTADEVVEADRFIWYVPFEKVMNELAITCKYYEDEAVLLVYPVNDNIFKLPEIVNDILKHKGHSMYYWRTAENYGLDDSVALAKAIDYCRNWEKLPEFFTGMGEYEDFENAVRSIMLPNENNYNMDAEISTTIKKLLNLENIFVKDTSTAAQAISEIFLKYEGEKWETADILGKETAVMLEIFSKGHKVIQAEDLENMLVFADNLKNVNSNTANGLMLIQPYALDTDEQLAAALTNSLELYNGDQSAVWNDMCLQLLDGTTKVAVDVVTRGFMSSWIDAVNWITDEAKGTQKQIDGILNAWANLTIQDACKKPIEKQMKRYNKSNNYTDKANALKDMRDIALVYMYAALNAQTGFDDRMYDGYAVAESRDRIAKLLQYTEMEFNLSNQIREAENDIISKVHNSIIPVEISWKNDFNGMASGIGLDVDSQLPYGEVVFNADSRRFEKTNGFTIMSENQADSGYRNLSLVETDCPVEIRIYRSDNTDPAIGLAELRLSVKINYEEVENLYSYKEFDSDGEYIRLVFEKGKLKQ